MEDDMKTNQIMIRQMGQFQIQQRTKDEMFNATSLLKQWNAENDEKKEITKFFENDKTQEFISALMLEEKLDTQNSAYVKSKARLDRGGGTWMHPILFIKFAMWLNPRFEVIVIKFVYDQMIRYRNEAGDAYRDLSAAVNTIVPRDFMPIAMCKIGEALNWIVFNNHKPMMRNEHGTEESMRELSELERRVADNIHDGLIRDYQSLINFLRTRYMNKHYPKVFSK